MTTPQDDADTLLGVREALLEQVCDLAPDLYFGMTGQLGRSRERAERSLDLIAVLGRTDATLEDYARVADDVLCWDSASFVGLCGVHTDDVRARDLTPADRATLDRLNGGRPFTYDLSHWST